MTLFKYHKPTSLMRNVNEDFLNFDQLVNKFFGFENERLDNYNYLPPVNLQENNESYQIELAIPGVKKENIEILIEKNILTIKSKNEETKEETNESYSRKEFNYSKFERTFTLPKIANTESINANFEDGILKIEIAKLEEAKEKPARLINIS